MKKIENFEDFSKNENLGNPLVTIDDFMESFPNFKVDWMENNIDDFAHGAEDFEDFDEYIIVDESIEREKEYVFVDVEDDDNEIYVYTNTDGIINGYAFNKD